MFKLPPEEVRGVLCRQSSRLVSRRRSRSAALVPVWPCALWLTHQCVCTVGHNVQGHIGEFNCALQKRILLQGRLYLFDSYVCFYSNVFGYVHTKVIPLADVTAVCKKKTALVVPNAIEVESTRLTLTPSCHAVAHKSLQSPT